MNIEIILGYLWLFSVPILWVAGWIATCRLERRDYPAGYFTGIQVFWLFFAWPMFLLANIKLN